VFDCARNSCERSLASDKPQCDTDTWRCRSTDKGDTQWLSDGAQLYAERFRHGLDRGL
jgi:hypothetical protein